MKFLKNLMRLLKIALRKVVGRETISLVLISVLMVVRSTLSIYISDVNGDLAKSIIRINLFDFIKNVNIL